MADFIIDIFRTRDRLRNLLGKQFTVALTEPVDGGLRGRFRKTNTFCGVRVGNFPAIAEEELFEPIEPSAAAPSVKLLAQTSQYCFKHRLRPAPLVELIRRGGVRWQELISCFGAIDVFQRKELLPATTFLAIRSIPFVGEVILQSREQKSAEPSAFAISRSDQIFFQKPCEKTLREVLRVGLVVAAPPHKIVKWLPVLAAEPVQGVRGLHRRSGSSADDDAPMSGCENPGVPGAGSLRIERCDKVAVV